MNKYFDVHNHLFNKHFLGKELLYRMMKELRKFLDFQKDRSLDRGSDRGLKNVITSLKRYKKAIKVFTQKNSIAIYEELDKTYKGEFILTPLTFDLTYCFASSADRDLQAAPQDVVKDAFEDEMDLMFDMVEQHSRELSRDFNPDAETDDDELWNEYIEEKSQFMEDVAEFQISDQISDTNTRDRSILKLPGASDGWNEQLRQIEELKKHPKYKDMVYPFLAIDPRRPGIAEYAKANVGKGKLFAGVKLYCPNGYSPTDPLLFGADGQRDGIYAFCEDNGIPVTAHNSDGGFATLSKSVYINGLIHVNGKLIQLNNELLKFSKTITEKDAVYERALTINHPLIWGKVAEKYPNLLLNLAHFGGGRQLGAAMDNPDNLNLWSNRIIELIKNPEYKVYTDVSCFSDLSAIDKLIASTVYPEIRKKILYGSDYTLLLLFEDNFDENVSQFRSKFGSDFDIIARDNPQDFLKNVI